MVRDESAEREQVFSLPAARQLPALLRTTNTMASTENDFFAAQANAEYPLLRQQLAALEKLVTDPAVPACKVAQDICAPIIAARQRALANPDHPDEYGYSILWRTIADAIRDLTDQNDRLVNLVVEISKVQDEEGYITHMYDYNEYWSSEGFECTFRKDVSIIH